MELLNRRRFLRASGVSLALPLLERMGTAQGHPPEGGPHRMVAICTNLGILEKNFLPSGLYLQTMAEHEGRWTVFSGVSHPEVGGGHSAEDSFLTAAPHPGTASFRNSISLDQYAAERMGLETRFPSLALCVSQKGNPSLSWTSSGVMLPAERKPSEVFKSLFVSGDAAARSRFSTSRTASAY